MDKIPSSRNLLRTLANLHWTSSPNHDQLVLSVKSDRLTSWISLDNLYKFIFLQSGSFRLSWFWFPPTSTYAAPCVHSRSTKFWTKCDRLIRNYDGCVVWPECVMLKVRESTDRIKGCAQTLGSITVTLTQTGFLWSVLKIIGKEFPDLL